MAAPPSRRAILLVAVSTSLVVVAILLFFIWSGPASSTSCAQYGATHVTALGQEYCMTNGPPITGSHDARFLGFAFQLFLSYAPGGPVLTANITEPNHTTYSGAIACGQNCSAESAPTGWFTPDGAAGVVANWNSGNTSLLVAVAA